MEFKTHVEHFSKLLENVQVADFLNRDTCGALCDKYHLIIIFQYFMRAEFKEEDYTTRNFFLALALSHDLYDESKTMKQIITTYHLSRHKGLNKTKVAFHWDKLLLFQRMQFKGYVEKKICQKLCQLIQHRGFYKHRKELHTGIVSCSILCEKCKCPMNKTYCSTSQKSENSDVKSDKSKTPCNIEDISDFITQQRAKRPKHHNNNEQEERLFFRHSESDHFSDEKSVATSFSETSH